MKQLLVYSSTGFISYPLNKTLTYKGIHFVHRNNLVFYALEGAKEKQINQMLLYTPTEIKSQEEIHRLELIEGSEVVYYRQPSETIFINNDPSSATFQIENYTLSITPGKLRNPEKQRLYINGVLTQREYVSYKLGDHLKIGNVFFVINEDIVTVYGDHTAYKTHLTPTNPETSHLRNFPNYYRSPRLIHRVVEEKVDLTPPKEPSKMSKGSLMAVIMTPLMSLAASVAMILIMNRGPFVYIMIATTLVTMITSIMKYISDKKQLKIENKEKDALYESYLLRTRKRLESHRTKEIKALAYHHPSISDLAEQVRVYSSRIYEKDRIDEDFLQLTMGSAFDKSSLSISLKDNEIEVVKDQRVNEIKELKKRYSYLNQKPTTVDLKRSHVGLVGDPEEIHHQIKQMLAQITFFHSYHDVEIIMLYNQRFMETFEYVKWYPHMRISAINVRGNIFQEQIRDQILASLTQILKQRKQTRDEEKKMGTFHPHYVIFIDDYSLVMNHSIMEYLQEATTELGFTLVFSAKQKADLPENIKTVVLVEDLKTNRLLMKDGKLVDKSLDSPQVQQVDLETMARDLSVLKHQLGIQSRIPESITFFDLYKIKEPKELGVLQKWQENNSHKTLSVPLGVRGEDDVVSLDLHEKAHGPHGLVAGTTGSGKSEIIQSYILSLAINFHPHEVGFLLIDYKGGGMANLFNKLPHLLGTITNLDGSESMRALVSIKSELKRRQKIFNDHDVNNIIKYNKLFKAGQAKEPLPSLFLISDEFAELKKEQPEFMSELVSVARIGRTLGIKLILATQKPTGVVDDQIWSNSKFKLALKVQDESDSKEVIKTPDAAYITQAGRAILQVGNNEIYETFQSAWSGATYEVEGEEKQKETFVYRINDIGQEELVNKDLSDLDQDSESGVKGTQLDVIIDHIEEIHSDLQPVEVMKPWLPSLGTQLLSPHFTTEIEDVSHHKRLDLKIALGMVDIPEKQQQMDYTLDFMKDGNLAMFAGNGFGKSFLLGNIMMSLAIKNSPELLEYYIIDLGNAALIPYANLPHTADYMTFDSEEKLTKFTKLITTLIAQRKKLFAKTMVQNFQMYNQLHPETPLKATVVYLDNYDLVKEMDPAFATFFTRLARDGSGLGIYTVATGSIPSGMRHSTMSQFKNKIAGVLYEKNDYVSVVGRPQHLLPEIKGRAMVKLEEINTMQLYTPFAFEDVIEYVEKTKTYIQQLKEAYRGDLPKGIPVLPETFTSNQMKDYADEKPDILVRAGLCLEEVVNVDSNLFQSSPYVIIGPAKTGKTNVLELYLTQMPEGSQIHLFDSPTLHFFNYKDKEEVTYVMDTEESIHQFMESMIAETTRRKEAFHEQTKIEPIPPQTFYNGLPKWMIFIDGIEGFVKKVATDKQFDGKLKEAFEVGIGLVVTTVPEQMKATDTITKMFKTATHGVVLGDQGTTTTSVFPVVKKDNPIFGQGLLFENGNFQRIQIPHTLLEK